MHDDRPVTAYLDAPLPLVLAHRGGAAYGPNTGRENTGAAFAAALALGVRYLETDVHVSRDGVVFAFHDADLARLTDVAGAIRELPASTVRAARVAGTEPVAEFAELLERFPDARFNVDVKDDAALVPTLRVVERADALDRVLLASFSGRRLRRARRLSSVATALTPAETAVLRLVPGRIGLAWVRRGGGVATQVPRRRYGLTVLTPGLVARAHRIGVQVHVWTVDDPAEMTELLDLGVDGLVTDRPDLAVPLVAGRGGV